MQDRAQRRQRPPTAAGPRRWQIPAAQPLTSAAMDTRWQPALDHPPTPEALDSEARGLFAAGWYATRDEGRIVHPMDQTAQLVAPQTWRALRELGASVPVRLVQQDPA